VSRRAGPTIPRRPRPDPGRHGRKRASWEQAGFRAYARDRDPAVRERLITAYLPLAASIARRFVHGDGDLLDELRQVAAIGLVKAVDRFDPARGVAFSTFAVPTIQGEVRRYFRDSTWAVRPPRDLQEQALRLERQRTALTEQLGRTPTAGELADAAGCTLEDVVDALEAMRARVSESLARPAGADGDETFTLADALGREDPGFAAADDRASLAPLLATLSDRERIVVELYVREDLTQAQIGRRLGCSQMHVSRIVRGAMARLEAAARRGLLPPR
jgi:RNA polymerase sigma-B factor